MSRDYLIMYFFVAFSVVLLVATAIRERHHLRLFFALAVSGDLYSVYANSLGVGLGYWDNPVRLFPDIFKTSLVYDLLFFPAALVAYLAWMPQRARGKILYTLIWVAVISLVELWLENHTQLIRYHGGWTIWKTTALYLLTYLIFCGLFRWLSGRWPGERRTRRGGRYTLS